MANFINTRQVVSNSVISLNFNNINSIADHYISQYKMAYVTLKESEYNLIRIDEQFTKRLNARKGTAKTILNCLGISTLEITDREWRLMKVQEWQEKFNGIDNEDWDKIKSEFAPESLESTLNEIISKRTEEDGIDINNPNLTVEMTVKNRNDIALAIKREYIIDLLTLMKLEAGIITPNEGIDLKTMKESSCSRCERFFSYLGIELPTISPNSERLELIARLGIKEPDIIQQLKDKFLLK